MTTGSGGVGGDGGAELIEDHGAELGGLEDGDF